VGFGSARGRYGLNQRGEAESIRQNRGVNHQEDRRVLREGGKLALLLEKPQEAEEFLRRALTADPYEPDAVYAYSQALHQLGRLEEANQYEQKHAAIQADLRRLDELGQQAAANPRDPELRYEMGVIFLRNGRELDGVGWLKTALKIDPRHSATHQALADYFERKGMKREAAEHRR